MMEKKRILILVKVEPAPSKKYGSTVCTAGITEYGEFIRLYPIPFSLFCDKDRKFSKYDWIECECEKAEPGDDARKESYKVKADSIHVVGHIDTDYRWAERNNIVRPHISRNFKELVAEGSSLGIIRPKEVLKFVNEPVHQDEDEAIDKECKKSFQMIFNKSGEMLKIPEIGPLNTYYRYHFKCEDDDSLHAIMCEDWELYESARSWISTYKTDEATWKAIHNKYFREFCDKKDLCFVVGTHHIYKTWMIIGVYYPPKGSLDINPWF